MKEMKVNNEKRQTISPLQSVSLSLGEAKPRRKEREREASPFIPLQRRGKGR